MLYNNPKTWSKNIDYKTFFNSRCSEKCNQDFCSLGILKKSLSDAFGRPSTFQTHRELKKESFRCFGQIHIHNTNTYTQ